MSIPEFPANGYASRTDLDSERLKQSLLEFQELEQRADLAATCYWNRQWEYPFSVNAVPVQAGRLALDAGAGRSPLPLWLALRGCRVVALDSDDGSFYSEGSLSRWYEERQHFGPGLLSFEHGDVRRLHFPDDKFDLVYSISVLEHLDDPLAALRELWRVLRPGGALVVTADVSLDDRRELRRTKIEEGIAYLRSVAQPILAEREVEADELLSTDWCRRNDPQALPWPPAPRGRRTRLKALLRGEWSKAGKWTEPEEDPGFYSMAVIGLAYRKSG